MSCWGLTRMAYGCGSLAEIIDREPHLLHEEHGRASVMLHTARAPRRPLQGGSLFWIVQHMIIARQPILEIREPGAGASGQKVEIHLAPGPIPVQPIHRQSHQGWRYLPQELWPPDLARGEATLPPDLATKLAELFLT